jgi:hypothetical protein
VLRNYIPNLYQINSLSSTLKFWDGEGENTGRCSRTEEPDGFSAFHLNALKFDLKSNNIDFAIKFHVKNYAL